MSGYETPLSERSTQHGASEGGGDSPRYLTPPDLNACGDRVLVSMEDKTIGMCVCVCVCVCVRLLTREYLDILIYVSLSRLSCLDASLVMYVSL